jgi:site-specific recombinase XerD
MLNALSDFIIFCRVERRLAELTCKAYERDVRACIEFLRAQGMCTLVEIRTSDLRRFLAEEATHRPAASSQARTVAALRRFFRFCVESEHLDRDPAHVPGAAVHAARTAARRAVAVGRRCLTGSSDPPQAGARRRRGLAREPRGTDLRGIGS